MADVRPLQQKSESPSDARVDFECGLEGLMRGHSDDCMSLTSCISSPRNNEDEEEDGSDQLVYRRRRSVLEGDDLAESSAARRCHSRILSRWAARQAQEMITTIERRNRESELMALAGLHPVSMLDYSFLRENQLGNSRSHGNVERPRTRASSILQMWRELEDEHVLDRARERVRERLRHERTVDDVTDALTVSMSESRVGDDQGRLEDEDASESDHDFEHGGNYNHSSTDQSPNIGEVERERVRQIVRGWMETGINEHSSDVTSRGNNGNSREEWLGETERERVRLVREWVHISSQQRARGGRRGDQFAASEDPADRGHGARVNRQGGQTEHRREMLRLRGRQALIDLLMRLDSERQRELQGLLEHRAVSDFAHRNRIQSLLRGRFLRTERTTEDERPPSVAANELLQLRQRHTVSGLRDVVRSRLETIARGQANSYSDTSSADRDDFVSDDAQNNISMGVPDWNSDQIQPTNLGDDISVFTNNVINGHDDVSSDFLFGEENSIQRSDWQEMVTVDERMNLPPSNSAELDQWRENSQANVVGNWQEPFNTGAQQTANGNGGEDVNSLVSHHIRIANRSGATLGSWSGATVNLPRPQRNQYRRINRFHPTDDDNVYSMELRELLSRRSVSTLLHSGFRESLDQLIQSYVERQGRTPIDWDLHRNSPTNDASLPDLEPRPQETIVRDTVNQPPFIHPVPPVPPPQPLWQHDLHHSNWSRRHMRRSELEWEMMNDLRADVARLQQGMNHMQRTLEACVDMQVELQRSVQQEVSAALNRSTAGKGFEISVDGSRWRHVRKGTCCVCCDDNIDSLLYRCGHMCTCLKCAHELVRGGGKCPLCRAPIVEVIRAYSVM